MKIRVLIADDTDIAREGLRRILAAEPDIEVIDEGATLHETLEKTQRLHPNILLLDLKWFGDESAGIAAIKRLRQEVPDTKIIAITVYPQLIESARTAGAVSALTKEVPKKQLIDEIRSVSILPVVSPPPRVDAGSNMLRQEDLSEREREVLLLMSEGHTDKEIAQVLMIAESTAKNHVGNILAKLDVPNRARAVAVAYEIGLIKVK